jgi:hypothetical protein
MEYQIAHACGHKQAHYLSGFASQMDRKAAWLRTTNCKSCFVAEKRLEQADAAAGDSTAIAHLDLVALTGSDRQVAWASTIRAKRLAAIIAATPPTHQTDLHACRITEAKWWIDHRDLSDADILAKAEAFATAPATEAPIMIMAQSI